MTTLTKATLITFEQTVDSVSSEWLNEILAKIDLMKSQGKTDGNYEFVDINTTKRYWLDQTTAEEWTDFVNTCSAKYSVVVSNITFEDATVSI